MRRRVVRLLALIAFTLGTVVTVLLGVLSPPLAAGAPPEAGLVQIYAYDGDHDSAGYAYTTTERGPPLGSDYSTAHGAVDRWSRGASARSEVTGDRAIFAYDRLTLPVQLTALRTTPQVPARGASGESLAVERAGVAAKTRAVGDDLLKPGPWARDSVPSSAPGKITQSERDALNPIGDAYGCHSCGATTPGTKSRNWIGDHQPPSRMAGGGPQVLYPHCQTCSNAQGLWIINLIRRGLL